MDNDTNQINGSLMKIANADLETLKFSNSEDAKNQISMFLVAQARNELYRIVKLTTFLDQVEANYIDTATMLMEQYPDNLALVQGVLETIEKSINRSNELLTQILKDDKLNTYIFISDKANSDKNEFNLDRPSREKIRQVADGLIKKITALESTTGEDAS